jgi:hypothetical protein
MLTNLEQADQGSRMASLVQNRFAGTFGKARMHSPQEATHLRPAGHVENSNNMRGLSGEPMVPLRFTRSR